jgi:hypothetical protein
MWSASVPLAATIAAGSQSITAVFTPTDPELWHSSTSAASPLTVGPATTAVSIVLSSNSTPAVATATVTPIAGVHPAGVVTFYSDAAVLGTATPGSNGVAAYTIPNTVAVGHHAIDAVFRPTNAADFTSATSNTETLTVVQPPPTPPPAATTAVGIALSSTTQAYLGAGVVATAATSPVNGVQVPGAVTFYSGSTPLATVTTSASGIATYTYPTSTALGVHSIHAVFTPNNTASYKPATSATVPLTVAAVKPGVRLALSSAAQTYDGARVVATATVAPVNGAHPAGAASFYSGSTHLATVTLNSAGAAGYAFSATTAKGAYAIKVVFIPSNAQSYTTVTSASTTLTVETWKTSTGIALNSATQVYEGARSVATATATAANGAHPAGLAYFYVGTSHLGTVRANSAGVAAWAFPSTLSLGAHNVVVKFIPDNGKSYVASASATTRVTVVQLRTSTAIALSSSTQVYEGARQVATAKVAPVSGVHPAGHVYFYVGSTHIATVTVSAAGTAAYRFSSTLSLGGHAVKAVFVPTSKSYLNSTSASLGLSVVQLRTSTIIALSSSTQVYEGARQVATATVAPVNGVHPSGHVYFYVGSTHIATVTVNSAGVAAYGFPSTLSVGGHAVKAVFVSATKSYVNSTSASLGISVVQLRTSTAYTLSSATQTYAGARAVATATVAPVNGVHPGGHVYFYIGSSHVATVTANSAGVAYYGFSPTLAVGGHTVKAVFVPTSKSYLNSTSPTSVLSVGKAPATMTATLHYATVRTTQHQALSIVISVPGVSKPTGVFRIYVNGVEKYAYSISSTRYGRFTATLPTSKAIGTQTLSIRYYGTSSISAAPVLAESYTETK